MFKGKVNLIKRGKVTHVGVGRRNGGKLYIISACNGYWKADDEVSIEPSSEVTCKRCLKILERADENGEVQL